MAFGVGILGPATPRITVSTRSPRFQGYDSSSSTDSVEPSRKKPVRRSRPPFITSSSSSSGPNFLFPPFPQSGRSSRSSTPASSPLQSRPPSPFPHFFSSNPSSSCTSDSDTEPDSPLLQAQGGYGWRREERGSWWMIGMSTRRRRRKRDGRIMRNMKRWVRRIYRHPAFPRQPITIVLTLLLLSVFAVFLTLLLIYILNPDKEPLPWRAYCSVPSPSSPPVFSSSLSTTANAIRFTPGAPLPPFPPPDFYSLPPAGVFVGVFSVDSAFERRMLVRTTWASHPRSREGADSSDGGAGTSRTIVRFILGQPRKEWERRVLLEMQVYNDIVILPVPENMNSGKTHSFFSWASLNAWVPPIYLTSLVPPRFSYSNFTAPSPPLAPHDSPHAWEDQASERPKRWSRPDFVIKVDDDSFVMLAELEARLRVELHLKPHIYLDDPFDLPSDLGSRDHIPPATTNISIDPPSSGPTYQSPLQAHSAISSALPKDPLVYWGYLVKNRFMAGELYGLSWSLVDWVGNDPVVKGLTKGAEDKQTAKWIRLHPRASEVRWASERCWMYDHPRSGTVYSHGFLFPSEVTRVRRSMMSYLDKIPQDVLGTSPPSLAPLPPSWTYSSVSTFGVRYTPPMLDLTILQSVEALVEGSDMSKLREGSPMTPDYAWQHREGRIKRYERKRVGGTVVVHFIKKNMWFLETAMALLQGEEYSESEKYQRRESEEATMEVAGSESLTLKDTSDLRRPISKHRASSALKQ